MRNRSPRVIEGTDNQALDFSARVHAHFARSDLLRVEAHSIAVVDLSVPTAKDDRIQFKLRQRGNVWQYEPNQHVPAAKDTDLKWLINLAGIRSVGYASEIQIFDADGAREKVVLIDQRNDEVG